MTNPTKPITPPGLSDHALSIVTAPSIAAFATEDIEKAIRTALPGGQNMTTEQVRAAAITAKTTDLNPMLGEFYQTQLMGTMEAAKSKLSSFNAWMKSRGEVVEWVYEPIGSMTTARIIEALEALDRGTVDDEEPFTTLCKALDYNPSQDIAVLCKCYLRSSFEHWHRQVSTALMLGMKPEDAAREFGMRVKPDYEAWGIVRFKEQKDDKDNNGKAGKTARQKWEEMDLKYNRLERAKKRGRTACVQGLAPVSTALRKTLHKAEAAETDADDIVIDDVTRAHISEVRGAHADVDAEPVPTPDTPPEAAANGEDVDPVSRQLAGDEESPAPPQPQPDVDENDMPLVPAKFDDMRALVDRKASFAENKGYSVSDGQANFFLGALRKLTGKDEQLWRAVLFVLTGQTHWGDITPHQRYGIGKAFLEEYDASAQYKSRPREAARVDVEMVRAWIEDPAIRSKFE